MLGKSVTQGSPTFLQSGDLAIVACDNAVPWHHL